MSTDVAISLDGLPDGHGIRLRLALKLAMASWKRFAPFYALLGTISPQKNYACLLYTFCVFCML
jgi:hypothetical protein